MGDDAYRLAVGRVVVELRCREAGFPAFLARHFGRPSARGTPAVVLDLAVARDAVPRPVPNSLLRTKRRDGDGFDIDDGLVRGRFDPVAGRGQITVRSTLLRGRMMRVFEQLLYQAFHSGARRLGASALLVHAAGVARDGRGYLFVGPSGAGKSTVAGLSGAHHVLNDEMTLVDLDPDAPLLVGTPFNGFFPDKRPGQAPLAAVLLLEQGREHACLDAPPAAAAARVGAEVVPPVGLEDLPDARTPVAMIDGARALLQRVPARRLVFRRDAGFWGVVPG